MRSIPLVLSVAALVVLAGCSGAASPAPSIPASIAPSEAPASVAASPSPAAGGGVTAAIAGFAFDPGTITAAVGQAITWTNEDGAPHTVTLDDGSVDSPTLQKGDTFSHTFGAAGTYAYHCKIHPTMKGTVEVSG